MFGYVRAYKDELRVKEYDTYRAYYCGLCMTLKKEYGFFARFGLNYDAVFLALLLSAVTDADDKCSAKCCMASPFKKKPMTETSPCLSYSAGVMVMLAMLKLADDVHDEKSVKSAMALISLSGARRRVMKQYGMLYESCKAQIKALTSLEHAQCDSIDALADTFGTLMQHVFTPPFIKDENTRRILSHIGYLLGRFIYILDAYEDMEKDKKKHCFNVFLTQKTPPDKDALRDSLTLTLSSIANSYELLNIKQNNPILDNILYLGLPHVLDNVLDRKGDKKDE